jgi:hypothetical protein
LAHGDVRRRDPCQIRSVSGRDRDAPQLRAVAPLVALGQPRRLVGPVALVANGAKVVGVTSAELLRPLQGTPVAVMTKLDGSALVPVVSWTLGRYSGLALIELGARTAGGDDVVPLDIGAVCATIDTRGAPAVLATIAPAGAGFVRTMVEVRVEPDDGGGMTDTVKRLATPVDPAQAAGALVEGALLFAWFPPDPALGRPSEVLATALAYPLRSDPARPRHPSAIAELIGLDDLGRVLLGELEPEARDELPQVAGEIEDRPAADRPIGVDE